MPLPFGLLLELELLELELLELLPLLLLALPLLLAPLLPLLLLAPLLPLLLLALLPLDFFFATVSMLPISWLHELPSAPRRNLASREPSVTVNSIVGAKALSVARLRPVPASSGGSSITDTHGRSFTLPLAAIEPSS